MKVFSVFLVLVFHSSLSFASLAGLAKDFLESNSDVIVARSQVKLARLDYEAFDLQTNTNLSLGTSYNDNSLESFSAFAAQFAGGAFRLPIRSTEHTIGLGKSFSWGGELAFDNSVQSLKAQGARSIYGFSQGLTYTQSLGRDFLGRGFKKRLDELSLGLKFSESNTEQTIQARLLELVQSYFDVSLNKSLVKLRSEAESRAQRRFVLIKRRVRDGLREKVDKIQAEISLFQAKENVSSAKQNLTSALELISTAVHRRVSSDEVISFIEPSYKRTSNPRGEIQGNNNLKALQDQLKATKAGLDRADFNLIPEVTFQAGVRNNNFDPQLSNSFSDGSFTGNNEEVALSLNVVWALGSKPERVEKTRALVNYNTTRLRLEKFAQDTLQSERSIQDQIVILDKNILSAKRRLGLANQALGEYNKLYSKGRADLDQLISAEETLINTEVNYIQYLALRERLIHGLAFLYGNLKSFMLAQGI
jgi:outer membrane protein TolC